MNRQQLALFNGVHPTMRQVRQAMPLTAKALEAAEDVYVRAYASRCPHDPPCSGKRAACIRLIAHSIREKGYL